jgi:hypothetical protein
MTATEGHAIWMKFPRSIRNRYDDSFVRFPDTLAEGEDPIHSQRFYLSVPLLPKLKRDYGPEPHDAQTLASGNFLK